ncbi:hypothetical protein WCD74_16950 [Actinomycetospora sp. OC33-EN08]|uniref:Uncharacterized protein n=1 Tax=Actinomycetospora aurantiaca TaxID=3129233 RepID=A0ABU8MSR2_9PSEU
MTTLAHDDAITTRIPAQRPVAGGRHARPEPLSAAPTPGPTRWSSHLHPAEAPAGLGAAWASGGVPVPTAQSALGQRLADAFGPSGLHELPPPIRRHPRIALAVLGGFLLTALVLIVSLAVPGSMTVHGTFTAHGSYPLTRGASCWNSSYSAGTPVTVVDGSGAMVALGALGEGQATTDSSTAMGRYGYATDCTFSFTVTDVPEGEQVYGVRIGAMRNVVVFTADEMADGPAVENVR